MSITRRSFLQQTGTGSLAALGTSSVPAGMAAAIDNTEPMKIVQIDAITFRKDLHIGGGSGSNDDGAEFWWVQLHTDKGIVGTGETYPFPQAEIGALKEHVHEILGHDPRDIDGMWRTLQFQGNMRTMGGAEMRMLSAVNMAQLDILGQATGLPLYRLLGGRTRKRVRVYNTTTDYWAINDMKMGPDTLKIVKFLQDFGITGMKIYPFTAPDHYISNQALDRGLGWIKDIRNAVGNNLDICVDCWSRFDFTSAARIAHALEPYNIMYLEDAMLSGNAKAYARLAAETSVPINTSETLATRYEFREYMEQKSCDVVMFDVTWCGGPTEAKRIADLAETYLLPISPHTCGGPLLYICSAHLATAVPDLLIMESNYWKYTHQYPHFVSNAPVPHEGHVVPPELPGIGAGIKPEIFHNGDAIVETVGKL